MIGSTSIIPQAQRVVFLVIPFANGSISHFGDVRVPAQCPGRRPLPPTGHRFPASLASFESYCMWTK